jgi:hypothetical protein
MSRIVAFHVGWISRRLAGTSRSPSSKGCGYRCFAPARPGKVRPVEAIRSKSVGVSRSKEDEG